MYPNFVLLHSYIGFDEKPKTIETLSLAKSYSLEQIPWHFLLHRQLNSSAPLGNLGGYDAILLPQHLYMHNSIFGLDFISSILQYQAVNILYKYI